MQSAIGRIQLRKLPEWRRIRQSNASVLTEVFSRIPALRVTVPPPEIEHGYYKYYTFIRPERLTQGWDRDRIMAAISSEGIPCFSGSCSEIYLEKAFSCVGLSPDKRLPIAKELGETSVMFLVHPTLGNDEISDTCRAVEKVMFFASR